MVSKKKLAAATFGAALTSMYVAPELQADVVDLTFNPGSVLFDNVGSVNVGVAVGTTGGAGLGSFQQWNDAIGKTIFSAFPLGSIGIVQYSQTLNASSTFGGATAIGISTANSNKSFIGFHDVNGNVGWFSVNWGGSGGTITYGPGEYGTGGMSVHVGGTVIPEPSGLAGLAMLALGATGVRRNRKK